MRAVAVYVARRPNLARIDRPGVLGAGDEIAGADQLVVAVGLVEALAGLADAVPVFRWLEDQLVFLLVEAAAQPAPEKRYLGPGAAAQAGSIGFLCVREGGVFGIDSAIDKANDNAIPVQPLGSAQSAVSVE